MKTETKTRIKNVVIGVVIFAAVIAVLAFMGGVFAQKADSDGFLEISPDFSIGGLNEQGEFENVNTSFITKEAISCVAIKVLLEFDAELNYQLFFYDDYDNFISSTVILGKGAETELPEGATCCRIELTPVWESDVDEDDRTVNFFSKLDYTGKVTVKVIEEYDEVTDNTTDDTLDDSTEEPTDESATV